LAKENYLDFDQLNDKMSNIDPNINPSILPTPLDSPVKEKTAVLPPIHKDNKDTIKMSLNFKNISNEGESKPKQTVRMSKTNAVECNSSYKHLELINNIENIGNLYDSIDMMRVSLDNSIKWTADEDENVIVVNSILDNIILGLDRRNNVFKQKLDEVK